MIFSEHVLPGSNCSSARSSDEQIINGRCYIATKESVSWYEARNRCLKGGGDLASFANVTSINFTSWLDSDASFVRYWIELRFIWYTRDDSGSRESINSPEPTKDDKNFIPRVLFRTLQPSRSSNSMNILPN